MFSINPLSTLKDAPELNLPEVIYRGLILVGTLLEQNKIPYFDYSSSSLDSSKFNMCLWPTCIGGWMERHINRKLHTSEIEQLHELFFPFESDDNNTVYDLRNCITSQKASEVIFNYLRTGNIDWNINPTRSVE